jgi:glycosyltransferase involved in cell wall biosynthesis
MRCPELQNFQTPPIGKVGWPWTEESQQLSDKMPGGSNWPRISIVTPSLNQGQFIEETIRSVLLQGYPNLEYIIIDGGSTDNTLEIIQKYEKWLYYWVSEPDKGQSDAINKGFSIATGEIVAWLNSDDFYNIKAVGKVAKHFAMNKHCHLLCGDCIFIGEDGDRIKNFKSRFAQIRDTSSSYKKVLKKLFFGNNYVYQPSAFMRSSVFSEIGYLKVSLHYAMDLDLWLRIIKTHQLTYLPVSLSCFRFQPRSKTTTKGLLFWYEKLFIASTYSPELFVIIAVRIIRILAENSPGFDIEKGYLKLCLYFNENTELTGVLNSLKKHEKYIISKAYILKADIEYDKLQLNSSRNSIRRAVVLNTKVILTIEFVKLFPRVYLPKNVIKMCRKYTRSNMKIS